MNEKQFNPLADIAEVLSSIARGFFPPQTQPPDRLPALGEMPVNMVLPAENPAPPVAKSPGGRASREIIPLLYE